MHPPPPPTHTHTLRQGGAIKHARTHTQAHAAAEATTRSALTALPPALRRSALLMRVSSGVRPLAAKAYAQGVWAGGLPGLQGVCACACVRFCVCVHACVRARADTPADVEVRRAGVIIVISYHAQGVRVGLPGECVCVTVCVRFTCTCTCTSTSTHTQTDAYTRTLTHRHMNTHTHNIHAHAHTHTHAHATAPAPTGDRRRCFELLLTAGAMILEPADAGRAAAAQAACEVVARDIVTLHALVSGSSHA